MPHPDIDNCFAGAGYDIADIPLDPEHMEDCSYCGKECSAQELEEYGFCFQCWKGGPPEFPGADDETQCPICGDTCIQADLFHLGCCGCETNLENERLTCAF